MSIDFENFLRKKSVAIVGPAQYMMSSNFGKEIDQFDIVVRINRSCESIEKYSQDVGSRTDILYSCLIEKPSNAGTIDVEKYKNVYGIKFVCAPPESDIKGISTRTKLHSMVSLSKVEKLNKEIPVRVVGHEFHSNLANKIQCRPNTGFLAIYDLLRHDIEKIKIFGFSFYLDGFVKGVKSGLEKDLGKTEDQFANQCFDSKRHVQKNMWAYAKNTLLERKNVSLDPYLKVILELENLDKNKYNKKIGKGV